MLWLIKKANATDPWRSFDRIDRVCFLMALSTQPLTVPVDPKRRRRNIDFLILLAAVMTAASMNNDGPKLSSEHHTI